MGGGLGLCRAFRTERGPLVLLMVSINNQLHALHARRRLSPLAATHIHQLFVRACGPRAGRPGHLLYSRSMEIRFMENERHLWGYGDTRTPTFLDRGCRTSHVSHNFAKFILNVLFRIWQKSRQNAMHLISIGAHFQIPLWGLELKVIPCSNRLTGAATGWMIKERTRRTGGAQTFALTVTPMVLRTSKQYSRDVSCFTAVCFNHRRLL